MSITELPDVLPVVRFDLAVAAALAQALDGLAEALEGARAAETARFPTTIVDWAGFTRTWFDQRHVHLVASLTNAAAAARLEARLVTTAPVTVP